MIRALPRGAGSSALLVSLALLLAACATPVTSAPTPPVTSAPTPPVISVSAAPVVSTTATPAPSASNPLVTEADNGRTLMVPVGSELTLELGSTYWQVGDSSDPAVLELVSGPAVSAAGMGACVPGGGCGTVTAVYRALAPGRAVIAARRTTCGEALTCTGTAGAYEVTVVVGR